MAYTYRPTSTLSAALNDTDNEFNVAATTNIVVGSLLVFRNETMKVRSIPVSGRVNVRRGYEGTASLAHASGETFFIGLPTEFTSIREHALGLFGGLNAQVPQICIPGVRAFDVNGYEYVLVDVTPTGGIVKDATVSISKDGLFTAAVLTSAHSGSVGILVEAGTSNQWCWALIRGYYKRAQLGSGSSLATSTGIVCPATSVSTPAVGLIALTTTQASSDENQAIYGMWPASASTTGTSASSATHTGMAIAVWLQYPYVMRRITS